MTKKKEQQKELPGMPERTPLGKKATEYLDAKDAVENAELERDKIKTELIQEFRKAGINSIKISGYVVSYSHKEKDSITAKEAV